MKTIAFFNSTGGVGKTTLVYHLAWMFAETGQNVLAADLDPQSNLTSMFLDEGRLEELWPDGRHPGTIYGAIEPILRGLGDIQPPNVEHIDPIVPASGELGLIAGDLALSGFEDKLSDAWPRRHNRDEAAFRTMTALHRALLDAAERRSADLVLIDVGPNLGAINRSALIASDYVVIPLAPDLYSQQGLRNLGPQLQSWRNGWRELRANSPQTASALPSGEMRAAGYVVMRHAIHDVTTYLRWRGGIPNEFRRSILSAAPEPGVSVESDPYCLATLEHYRSLMLVSREARKPMFYLKPADGAIGAHAEAVRDCHLEFSILASKILRAIAE